MKKIIFIFVLILIGGAGIYWGHWHKTNKTDKVEENLILHLKFDEMWGKAEQLGGVKDYSGKENSCLINGNPKLVKDGSDIALEFDGNDYIDCGNRETLNIKDAITIEAWIKLKDVITASPDAIIVMKGNFSYGLTRDERMESNAIQAYIKDDYIRIPNVETEKWQHVVFTYDRENIKLYINSSFAGQKEYNKPISVTDGNLFIGGNGGQNFHGLIGEIKIYNRALNAREILKSFVKSAQGRVELPEELRKIKLTSYSFWALIILTGFYLLFFKVIKNLKKDTKQPFTEAPYYLKISNGISVARIIAMLWIFLVNYFSTGIFRSFFGVEYQYAIEKSGNFINVMNSSPWFIDKLIFVLSYAGWSGVVAFTYLTGFSLWLSLLKSGKFEIGDYVKKRFNSIYVSYFIAVIISFSVGVGIHHVQPSSHDLWALIMGATKFVGSAGGLNTPLWFISVLFLLYLFFPIIPIIYHKFRFVGILIFTLLCSGLWGFVQGAAIRNILIISGLFAPFWLTLCIGVLMSHMFYKCAAIKIKNVKVMDIACVFIVLIGTFLLFKYIYLEPARDLMAPWFIKAPYTTGVIGALTFFSIGYLLPLKLSKSLRWLSRGTFGIFLYHYLLIPFLVPYIKPDIFTSHLSIALVIPYLVMLICLSVFQGILDGTIVRFTRNLSSKDYKIE